jgi:atypical dual specificity phosphatase
VATLSDPNSHSDLPDLTWYIEGELAAMGKPGTYTGLRRELEALKQLGIRRLLTLTEVPLGVGLGKLPFSHIEHLPIVDFTAPSLAELRRAVAVIEEARRAGEAILVHCYMGLGRTGTVIAAYLISRGWDAGEAVDYVRRLRPGSIQTESQLNAVYEFAARLEECPGDD